MGRPAPEPSSEPTSQPSAEPASQPTSGPAAGQQQPGTARPPSWDTPLPTGVVTGRTAIPAHARPAAPPAAPPPSAARPTAQSTAPAAPAAPAAQPAPGALSPAAAYGGTRAPARPAASTATREATTGTDTARAEAAWSATALAAGAGAGLARPAVLDDRTAADRAADARDDDARAATDPQLRPPIVHPGRPTTPRRPWTIAGLHVLQLVALEVAVVAVLLVHREPWWVLAPVAAGAALLTGLTLLRRDGRWAWQAVGARLRHLVGARRSAAPVPGTPADEAADDVLAALAGGGWVDAVTVDDVSAALLDHPGGVAVAVEAMPATESRFAPGVVRLPSLAALLPAGDDADTRLTAQLVVQTVPTPGRADADDPVGVSWRELTGGRPVVRRRCWIVLQVQRTPERSDALELRATLVNAVRRVQRQVRKAGLRGHLLSPEEARAGLLALAGAHPDAAGRVELAAGGAGGSRERWQGWVSAGRRHVGLRLVTWPDLGPEGPGRSWVTAIGEACPVPSVVAVAARRTPDGDLDVEGTVRIVLGADEPEGSAVDDVRAAARAVGARLRRADGEHRVTVASTLALGGFVR
ncbi:type VII secretion protein EccE [Klenkia marina]|uniref:Type VII secretion protein EccE n=2 Tax=Klenkia marina TaxID=1960309 RepID=A0A1G4XX35_9ACTN|nr:type VII secretion protein EccE [Klenkia marina]